MDFGQDEKKIEETKLKDLQVMIKTAFDLQTEVKRIEDQASEKQEELDKLKFKMNSILGEHNMSYFKSEFGSITRKAEFSVKVPKLQADREAFFAYLREKELFDQMITVNSKTLNSYVKEQRDAALDEGVVDFSIPGIEPGIEIYRISMRKA
jgi:hypothetical protein